MTTITTELAQRMRKLAAEVVRGLTEIDDTDDYRRSEYEEWTRKKLEALLLNTLAAKDKQIANLEFIRTSAAQVQAEHAEALGCASDNESILEAIDGLKDQVRTIDMSNPVLQSQLQARPEQQPVAMKDHQVRELVNQLKEVAITYHGTQQLRKRIAHVVRSALAPATAPAAQPVTDDTPAWIGLCLKRLMSVSLWFTAAMTCFGRRLPVMTGPRFTPPHCVSKSTQRCSLRQASQSRRGSDMEREYFILSVGHTQRNNPYIILWAENDAGYRGRIETAGRYTESHVKARLGYYNDGCNSVAVPCDVAERLSFPVRPGFFDDDNGRWIRNNRETWNELLKHVIAETKYKPEPEYRGAPRQEAV